MKLAMKPLEFQLAAGCAQQSEEYASPAGVRTATNVRLLKRGGLSKRPGARGLQGTCAGNVHAIRPDGSVSYVASPAFVSRVGEAPLIGLNDGQVFALDEVQASGTVFNFAGACSTAMPVRRRAGLVDQPADVSFGPKPGAVAVNSSGYILTAAINGGTTSGSLTLFIESPEGVRLYYEDKLVSAVQVRAHAVGALLWLVWQVGTSVHAQSFTIAQTVGAGSETTVATLFSASYNWDTSAYDGTHWFLIHGVAADGLRISKFAGTSSAATANFTTSTTAATPCSIWADPAQGNVWIGYYDDPSGLGGVNYRVYAASNLASVKGETTLNNGSLYGPPLFGPLRHATNRADSATGAFYCFRYAERGAANGLTATYTGNAWSNATAHSSPYPTWSVLPISKPDSRHRVWCIVDNGSAGFAVSRTLLLRWHNEDSGTPVVEMALPGMEAPGYVYGPANSHQYFHAVAVGANSTTAIVPRVLTKFAGVPQIQIDALEYATGEQASWRSTVPGFPSTVVAGGPVEFFASGYGHGNSSFTTDRVRTAGASEIGFAHGPTITASNTSGGSSVAAGSYSYRAVYEWVDLYGRRHRSEPSAPFAVVLAAARDVVLTVTVISATQRVSQNTSRNPLVVLYRTVNGGTTYLRTSVTATAVPLTGTVDITDTDADADIADEEPLYTDGGVLDTNIAPACRYAARTEDAVWFGGLFDASIIQRSKLTVPSEPVQCTDHPSHQVVLPGDCTGLAYMDGQLVAFTRHSVVIVAGAGPNDQGAGEFAPPRLHTTGLGCVDGRSVLETPVGVFFLSRRGIELIPRGFGPVEFVGAPVKDLVQASLLDSCGFSSYQSDKNSSYARFGLMDASVGLGPNEYSIPNVRYVATFDIDNGQWFIDDYGSETMGALGAWPNGFALVRTQLDSDSISTPIWYEDGSLHSNPLVTGAGYITSSVTCQRLFPFGHGGHGNVRRILVAFYSHVQFWTLTLSVQTDANTAQTESWNISTTGLLWREITLSNPRCTTVLVTVSDATWVGNGPKRGPTYLALAIESDPLEGARGLAEGEKR